MREVAAERERPALLFSGGKDSIVLLRLAEKAFAGELKEFTGVSDPYEEPASPELRLETEGRSPQAAAADVLEYLSGVPA